MADLNFQLDTLDGLPDEHKALYKESESGFQLDLAAYGEFAKAPVVKKNRELLGKLNQAKGLERLTKFQDVSDDDWDAFQQFREAQANGGNPGDGKSGSVEELKAKWQSERTKAEQKLKDEHARALAEKDKEVQQWRQRHQDFALKTQLQTLALKAGVLVERLEDFVAVHRLRFQVDEDGELVVLDSDGEPSTTKPERFITDTLREQKPWYFQAVEQGGSGSQGSAKVGTRGTNWKELSPTERLNFARRQKQRR